MLVLHLLSVALSCFDIRLRPRPQQKNFSDRKNKNSHESFTSCVEVNSCADASWSSGNIQHLTNRYNSTQVVLCLQIWKFNVTQLIISVDREKDRTIEYSEWSSFYRLLFPLSPWLGLISITFFIDFLGELNVKLMHWRNTLIDGKGKKLLSSIFLLAPWRGIRARVFVLIWKSFYDSWLRNDSLLRSWHGNYFWVTFVDDEKEKEEEE